jgi:hypothetical protein
MINESLFSNYFKLDNKILGNITSKNLFSLNIQIPNFQRIIDTDKIEEIIKYQCNYLKKNNTFNILGIINIHYLKETNCLYLTDGQHRFDAFKQMFTKMGHNLVIPIELIIVNNHIDLINNFKIINKNTPLPEFPNNIDKTIPEKASVYFKNKYPNIWSKNSRSRRPHIYFNFFQETLGFLTEKLKITSHENLIDLIECYNLKLSQWDINQFPEKKTINNNIIQKCKESGLYLGLFKHISDEYGYKWCQDIIKIESGIIVKDTKKPSKNKIPKVIKNNSWDKYIGKNIGEAYCICCNETKIDSKNFIAGHIISEKNNGLINIDNILPICNSCNSSMGITNMDIFIEKFYPKNINNFKNKKYILEKTNNNKKWTIF